MYSGIDSLLEGLEQLKKGTSNLSKGTTQLNRNTSNLDYKINMMIQNLQSEFNNSDFKAKSFISNNNNVINVQFVIQTDDLHKEEKKTKLSPIKRDNTFFGKIKRLFQ